MSKGKSLIKKMQKQQWKNVTKSMRSSVTKKKSCCTLNN